MAKNYFAVVEKKSGALILHGGTLPIFWYKSMAKAHSDMFNGKTEVKPINIKEFEKLLKNGK